MQKNLPLVAGIGIPVALILFVAGAIDVAAPPSARAADGAPAHHMKKLGIAEILYYIGGAIVFVGIAILIPENWTTLTFAGRLAATLGASIGAYIIASIFVREERLEEIGAAFYLISALTLPIGLGVVFDNAGINTGSADTQSLIAGISFLFFLVSFFLFHKNVLAGLMLIAVGYLYVFLRRTYMVA